MRKRYVRPYRARPTETIENLRNCSSNRCHIAGPLDVVRRSLENLVDHRRPEAAQPQTCPHEPETRPVIVEHPASDAVLCVFHLRLLDLGGGGLGNCDRSLGPRVLFQRGEDRSRIWGTTTCGRLLAEL